MRRLHALQSGLMLVPIGFALGPEGVGVLSSSVIALAEPGVAAALAALGVTVGLQLAPLERGTVRQMAASGAESIATMVIVGAGLIATGLLLPQAGAPPQALAALLAVCAAFPARPREPGGDGRGSSVPAGAADALPIVVGAAVLTFVNPVGRIADASLVMAVLVLIAMMVAAAVSLLVGGAAPASEHRVFSIGALLLLGGAAAQLSQSALLAGLVAGVFWRGVAADAVALAVEYVRRPLIVLLLLVAGAQLQWSRIVVAWLALYVLFLIVARLLNRWLIPEARRTAAAPAPFAFPGVTGIAFALIVLASRPAEAAPAVFAVAVAGALLTGVAALTGARPTAGLTKSTASS
jgi:hypothetical protein